MQTFLDYLTRRFGFYTFLSTAGPSVLILGATLLVLCGFLTAGCFHYRRTLSYRLYIGFSIVPLAWGIGIFTQRILEIIDSLEQNNGVWIPDLDRPPLTHALSEVTAVLLTCAILTGVFLALSPMLRPRTDDPASASNDREVAA